MADASSGTSTLEPAQVAAAAVRVGEPRMLGGRLHWLTTPPDAHGETRLVSCSADGTLQRLSPPGTSVRSALFHGGASSWCETALGFIGVDASSQRLGTLSEERFASVGQDPKGTAIGELSPVPGTEWLLAIREVGARRELVCVDVQRGTEVTLVSTEAFLAEPVASHDTTRIAWLTWPAGSMPWDRAELWVATLSFVGGEPALSGQRRADGGPGTSCGQPTWMPDGALAFVSEAAGFWQPWLMDRGGVVRRLSARRAEFQRPRWLHVTWLAALDDARLACAFAADGEERVGVLGTDGTLDELDQPCVRIDGVAAADGQMGWVGASVDTQGLVMLAGPGPTPRVRAVSRGSAPRSVPPPVGFTLSHEGVELAGTLWRGAATTPGPLVVSVHPGPTGATDRSYAPAVELLCAHGIAVASIDFSGSTGRGRLHRERLLGRFCELDVRECVATARHLVAAGIAAPDALFIRGTSAGGTTALLALAEDVFCGAVAWYPASSFGDDDGGFEEGYLRALAGPEPQRRSPLDRSSELRGRVLVVQGADDPVVPAATTRQLVEALERRGAVTYLELAGEGHGLRTAEGRAAALEAELAFYLSPSDPVPGVPREGVAPRYDATTGATSWSAQR